MTDQKQTRLLVIADIELDSITQQVFPTETNIKIVGIINNSLEGIQKAVELQADIILMDYYLPQHRQESGLITSYFNQENSGRLLSFKEYFSNSYEMQSENGEGWHRNFIEASKKIAQQVPQSKIIVMTSSSFVSNEFKQLWREGVFADLDVRPISTEYVLETIKRVAQGRGRLAKQNNQV